MPLLLLAALLGCGITDVTSKPKAAYAFEDLNTTAGDKLAKGDCEGATQGFTEALKVSREAELDPIFTAIAADNLGLAHKKCSRLQEAEKFYDEALAIRREHLEPGHEDIGYSLNNLGSLYNATGRHHEAVAALEEASAIFEKGDDKAMYAKTLLNLGLIRQEAGVDGAEKPIRKSLEIRLEEFGEDHLDTALSYDGLARVLAAQGSLAAARAMSDKALAIQVKVLEPGHPKIALAHNNYADILMQAEEFEEAIPHLEKSRESLRKQYGDNHRLVGVVSANLGYAYVMSSRADEAEPLYRQAMEVALANLGPDAQETKDRRERLAELLDVLGKKDEAAALRQ